MSASQDKRKRQNERAEGLDRRSLAEREAEIKKKKERTRWIAVTAIVLVLVVLLLLVNSPLLYTGTKSVSVGGYSYTNAEYQYFYYSAYNSFYNSYGSYASLFGLDTSAELDKQTCQLSTLSMFGLTVPDSLAEEESVTWEAYFRAVALQNMQYVSALYGQAAAAGYTLSEEDAATLDEELAYFDSYAESYSLKDGDAATALIFGKGVDKATVRELMERSYIAGDYAEATYEGLSYTAEELDAYYGEHKDQLDRFDYSFFFVAAETVDVTETVEDETTGEETEQTSAQVTEETMAAAEAQAGAILEALEAGDNADFNAAIADAGLEGEATVREAGLAYNMSELYKDWLLDSARRAGDAEVFESESGWYVVLFQARDDDFDYDLVSARHILIRAVDEDSDGTYSDVELAAAHDAIAELYSEWQAGEATEESFIALVEANSEDTGSNTNGGLYEHIYKGQMVEGFNDFVYASGRKSGDTAIVYGESSSYAGYHLVYFVGTEDLSYRDYLAQYGNGSDVEGLRNSDYAAWEEELLAANPIETNGFLLWFAKT